MHMGIQMIYSLLFGGGSTATDDKKENRRLSVLTPDERVLYDKIVRNLFDCCSADLAAKSDTPATYAIIFRQAESWDKVEKLIGAVIGTNPDYETSVWAERWLQHISDLRGLQKRVHDAGKEILAIKSQGSNHSEAQIAACRKTIITAKKRIQEILETAKKELANDSKEPRLQDSILTARVLRFLNESWLHLTVFSEWAEVPMDCCENKRLFVQIRQPLSTKIDESKFLNLSTKAIFTLEEIGGENRPKEIGMIRQCIGPKSPSPIRRTSSVILTAEAFFYQEYVEDLQKKYDDNSAKSHKGERSSIGDRLHFIVNIALDEVNTKLACKSDSKTSRSS